MRPTKPHGCPHCRCQWTEYDGPPTGDKSAPFYPLVEMIDALGRTRDPLTGRFVSGTA